MTSFAPHPLRTVLIVDDDADMRLYLRGCLRDVGCIQVLEAENGMEALQLLRTVAVHLIISDVLMPRLDGATLCRILKADPASSSIPIVLISGAATKVLAQADAFLAKPFNATMLRASVEPLLKQRP